MGYKALATNAYSERGKERQGQGVGHWRHGLSHSIKYTGLTLKEGCTRERLIALNTRPTDAHTLTRAEQ